MSWELDEKNIERMIKKGKKRIIKIGTSLGVVIPYHLFKMFWKKEDNVEMYIPNEYTIIIINKNAKEREIKSLKQEIEVNEKYIAPYRE